MEEVKLIGGPNHGELHQIAGGREFTLPIKYEHSVFMGTKICNSPICPDRGKHSVEIWTDTFLRVYQRVDTFKDGKMKTEYHYWGEKPSASAADEGELLWQNTFLKLHHVLNRE